MSDTPKPTETTEAKLAQRDAGESLKQQAENELKLTNQLVQARITSTEQLRAQQKIIEGISNKLGESFQAQQQFLDQAQINITNFSESFAKVSKNAEDAGQKSAALSKEYAELEKTNKNLYDALMNISKMGLEGEEAAQKFEELKGELQLVQAAGKGVDKSTKSFAKSMGFAGKISDTFTGSLAKNVLKLGALQTKAAKKELIDSFTNSIKETLSPLNLFSSLMDNLIKSALEFDKAAKNLSASFGELGAFQTQLTANSGELARMGLTASQQAELITELTTQFSSFTAIGYESQRMLKTNNGALKALGVSTSKANEIIETLTTGMGRSVESSSNLTVSLASTGKVFGKTSEQMIGDFASLSGYLSSYGDDMEKVFLGLQKQSKRTGIEVGKLSEMAKAFDTFSGSAKTAAQMNALFGTSISAMAMNTMDADQRLEEMEKQMGHLNVDAMSRYQKMALAEVLPGVNSVAEAVQFLGGTLTKEEQAQIDNIKLQKDMSETMQGLAKATLPLAKQLEVMFAEITSNEETVNLIISGLGNFTKVLVYLSDNLGKTLLVLTAFKIIGLALPPILSMMAAGTYSMGMAAKFAAGATGLGLFLTIMTLILGVFHVTRSPVFYLLFGVIAAGIFAMGMAAQTTQVGLYAIAAAALALGIAVSAIFYTISLAVDSFTNLFITLNEGADKFPKAASGLYLMAGGMVALGTASLIATSAITAALVGIGAITSFFTMGGTSVEDLLKAGDGMNKMGAGVEKFGAGLEKIKVVASELKNSLGDTLIAATMQGDKMSVIVGKEAGVATLFKNDTLNIKVDMPTINIPTPKFDVYIDGKAIDARIEKRSNK